MENLFRNSIYILKSMVRDKGFTFWQLIYPILLVSIFFTAFSGITQRGIETIDVGVERGSQAAAVLKSIEILNVVELSKDEIDKSLSEEKVSGYVEKDFNLLVDSSGLDQTVLKRILNDIRQTLALGQPLEKTNLGVNYLKEEKQEANSLLVIFYSLIAMVSTYGIFPGIEVTNISQANLTPLGARINTTPVKKSSLLISGVFVGLFMNIVSNTLLIIFIKYVLRLDIIKNLGYSILFILFGNLFGISLGIFIGSSNRKSQGFKNMLSIGSTLILSLIAGLMNPGIKVLIDEKLPLLARLNPISIITNNLYKINLLNNTKDLKQGIVFLATYSFILIFLSYLFLRRRQYDSI